MVKHKYIILNTYYAHVKRASVSITYYNISSTFLVTECHHFLRF